MLRLRTINLSLRELSSNILEWPALVFKESNHLQEWDLAAVALEITLLMYQQQANSEVGELEDLECKNRQAAMDNHPLQGLDLMDSNNQVRAWDLQRHMEVLLSQLKEEAEAVWLTFKEELVRLEEQ